MTAKTGNGDPWQPMTGADPARIRELGALLKLRRAELGYRHVPAFVRDRGINTRMVGDVEHGRRDTFTFPSLQDVARAYDVTYGSMMDVVWSDASDLVPASPPSPAALPVPGEPPGWMAADGYKVEIDGVLIDRTEADRPYADRIRGRLDMLRAQRIPAPSGAQLFPDSPDDARYWDKYDDWEARDRVWFIADLQRRADRSAPNSGTGTGGA